MAITDSDLDLAQYIDHSLLIPTATSEQLEAYCHRLINIIFPPSAFIPPPLSKLCSYSTAKNFSFYRIGFPAGATTPAVKRYEALEAVDNGAKG